MTGLWQQRKSGIILTRLGYLFVMRKPAALATAAGRHAACGAGHRGLSAGFAAQSCYCPSSPSTPGSCRSNPACALLLTGEPAGANPQTTPALCLSGTAAKISRSRRQNGVSERPSVCRRLCRFHRFCVLENFCNGCRIILAGLPPPPISISLNIMVSPLILLRRTILKLLLGPENCYEFERRGSVAVHGGAGIQAVNPTGF